MALSRLRNSAEESLRLVARAVNRRLLHGEQGEQERQGRRDGGDPEHGADILDEQEHQPDGRDGGDERPDRVERLTQPECSPAHFRQSLVGDDRIAGRAPYAFADPVSEARAHQLQRALRDREQGLGQGGKPIA